MNNIFHTANSTTLDQMGRAMVHAAETGRSFRIWIDPTGTTLKWKHGEGMWTGGLDADPDPSWACPPRTNEPDTDEGLECTDCGAHDGAHYVQCVWMP